MYLQSLIEIYTPLTASFRAMVTLGATSAQSSKSADMEGLRLLQYHLSLLEIEPQQEGLEEV